MHQALKNTRIRRTLRQAAAALAILGLGVAARAQDAATPASLGPAPAMRQFFVATHFHRYPKSPVWDVEKLIPRIKAIGAEGVRDGATWASVEKVKGQYNLPDGDRRWVTQCTDAGLKVVFVALYGNKIYDNELDPDAYANYCAYLASTFKDNPKVVAIELWNEPGNFYFRKQYGGEWNGRGNSPWIGKFAETIQKASIAIHKANPNMKVIAGAGVAPPMAHMLEEFPRAFDNLDGLVEHPYNYKTPPEVVPFGGQKNLERDGISVADDNHSMASLLTGETARALKATGKPLPVWVTEYGIATFRKQARGSLYSGFTESAQAVYHVRGLVQGLSLGTAIWTVYDFVDEGTDTGYEEDNFGLLRFPTTDAKPAYAALQQVARLLGPQWQLADAKTGTLKVDFNDKIVKDKDPWGGFNVEADWNTGPQVYWFKVPDGYVTFVWSAGRINADTKPPVGDLSLDLPGQVASAQLIDLCGNESRPLKLTATGTSASVRGVPVGSTPVAVHWIVR